MARTIVLIGPMGCGKSTVGRLLANVWGAEFADGDDFHPRSNIEKMAAGIPLTDEDREPWLKILARLIEDRLAAGKDLVLACSALKHRYRQLLGVDQRRVISVYLQGNRELLAARVASRSGHYMARELLDSQIETMEPPADGLTLEINRPPEELVAAIGKSLNLELETVSPDKPANFK